MGNCQNTQFQPVNFLFFSKNNFQIDLGDQGDEIHKKDFNKPYRNKQTEVSGGTNVEKVPGGEASESEDDELNEDDLPPEQFTITKSTIWDKIVSSHQIDKNHFQNLKNIFQNQQFKDEDFMPDQSSITYSLQEFPTAKNCIWLRQSEFSKGEAKVFEGKIEPNDIKQGSLGDCYFLSSLSALAEKPNLIARLFETKECNQEGLYCIWLCTGGQWQQVVIDDFFPCFKDSRQPAFSLGNGPELWVLILEKAYAKIHGCYANIEAGLTGDAIRDLTGAPYEYKDSGEEGPDAVWEFLSQRDEKGQKYFDKFICTAGSNQDDRGTEIKQNTGIISGHAYAVLDAQVVFDAQGNKARIIQLRNPWSFLIAFQLQNRGSNEWTGDWSDKSDKWTNAAKKQCKWQDADDGIFWMPIEEFCKSYSDITISYVHEDFFYSSHKVQTQGEKYFYIKFKVEKPQTLGYISLCQKNRRCYYGTNQDYEYSMASIIVYRVQETGNLIKVTSFYNDSYGKSRDLWVKHNFKRGEYVAMVHVEWAQDFYNDIVVSAYSQFPLRFIGDSLKFLGKLEYESILDECIVLKKPKPSEISTYGEQNADVFKIKGKIGGYVYYYYLNGSKDSVIVEKCFMRNRKGVTICHPYRDSDQFSIQLVPNDRKIVKYCIDPEANGAYSYGIGLQTAYQKNEWNW